MIPNPNVEKQRDENANCRKDCQVDSHLVDVVHEAVGLLAALGAPDDAGLVDDGADDERRRQNRKEREDRQGQSETSSLKFNGRVVLNKLVDSCWEK